MVRGLAASLTGHWARKHVNKLSKSLQDDLVELSNTSRKSQTTSMEPIRSSQRPQNALNKLPRTLTGAPRLVIDLVSTSTSCPRGSKTILWSSRAPPGALKQPPWNRSEAPKDFKMFPTSFQRPPWEPRETSLNTAICEHNEHR